MTHSKFPWSEGVSYVFDANDKVVCREPLLPELEGGHWNDNRKLIAAVPAMIKALEEIVKHMDSKGMQNWPIAKKARAALASIGRGGR